MINKIKCSHCNGESVCTQMVNNIGQRYACSACKRYNRNKGNLAHNESVLFKRLICSICEGKGVV